MSGEGGKRAMRRHVMMGMIAAILWGSHTAGAAPALALRSQEGGASEIRGLRAIDRLREFRFGPDRSMLDAAAEAVRAAMSSPEKRAEAADALAWVALSGAAFDARQFACRKLVYVATPEQIPAMLRLLADEKLAHYALMVLDRIPGPDVGAALRAALPRLGGAALLGSLDMLGERGEAASVIALERAANDRNPTVARAAITGLAKLRQPEADKALTALLVRTSGDIRKAVAEAIILRAASLMTAGKRAEAALLVAPLNARDVAAPIRAAALRITVLARGDSALLEAVAALQSSEREVAHMAAAVCREIPGSAATRRLVSALPKMPPASKSLLIDALADRRDPAAESGLLRVVSDSDSAVRTRAIAALGVVGGAASVEALLTIAASGSAEDRTAAATSLERLRGADVDGRILRALDDSSPGVRARALEAALRRSAAMPEDRVVRMAISDSGDARSAALQALHQIGTSAAARPLLEALVKTPDEERDAIAGAVVAIARREPSVVKSVREALEQAASPVDRVALLTCLGDIGGREALQALTVHAADKEPDVQIAALRALAEWPTAEPIQLLRTLAANPPSSRARAVALRGYLRMLRLPGGAALADAPRIYREALELTQSDDEKRLVLSGLGSVGSREALAMARSLADQAALRAEAEQAMLSIASMTAGAWPDETREALKHLAATAQDDAIKQKAASLLATMDRFGDFALTWEVSPAYEREATAFSALFDLAFPPETGASDAEIGWRVMPVGTAPEQPWLLDLLALYGGEQKVAYLRTAVWSDTEQGLVIEVGTDDGPKLWWNGEVVLANNTQRAVAPNQDRATVRARAGWNTALLKVTQNVMGWGACVRFADPSGQPARGIRLALPSFASISR